MSFCGKGRLAAQIARYASGATPVAHLAEAVQRQSAPLGVIVGHPYNLPSALACRTTRAD